MNKHFFPLSLKLGHTQNLLSFEFIIAICNRSITRITLFIYFFQQLQLLELIRAGRAEEALAFASATLAEAGAADRTALTELERSLALLAFPDPHASPFADLLLPSHSQKVSLY